MIQPNKPPGGTITICFFIAQGRGMVNQENRQIRIHYHPEQVVKTLVSHVIARQRKTPVAEFSEACDLILSAHNNHSLSSWNDDRTQSAVKLCSLGHNSQQETCLYMGEEPAQLNPLPQGDPCCSNTGYPPLMSQALNRLNTCSRNTANMCPT